MLSAYLSDALAGVCLPQDPDLVLCAVSLSFHGLWVWLSQRLTHHLAQITEVTSPCGYYGDPKRECRCTHGQVERYRQKISGPLLDHIVLHMEAPAVEYKELSDNIPAESSSSIRSRIVKAREIQTERFAKSRTAKRTTCNARMSHAQLKEQCRLDDRGNELLKNAMTDLNFSARAYDRILKVARTIADLADSPSIAPDHLLEALSYRNLDRQVWS